MQDLQEEDQTSGGMSMHTQPDQREPDEKTRHCPFCHLRIAAQEPQVSKHGQTFHEGCALKYDQLQQSPPLSTNATEDADDLAHEHAASNSGSVKPSPSSVKPSPSKTASATKMISQKKKAPTREAVRREPVAKALTKNPAKKPKAKTTSKDGPKRKTSNTKQQRRSLSRTR